MAIAAADKVQPVLLGAHVSIAGGLERAFDRAEELGCDAIQIFTKNQRQWIASPLSEDQKERWWQRRAHSDVRPAMAHASYLINLAARAPDVLQRSRTLMVDELSRCHALGIENLVVHPGAHLGAGVQQGLRQVVQSLEWVASQRSLQAGSDLHICLEVMAGQGTTLGRSFEELATILEHYGGSIPLGICLDSCHLFAAGYDLRDEQSWAEVTDRLIRTIGLQHLRCIHLNDSKHPLGSQKDRHQHIGEGEIGSRGFWAMLHDERLKDIPASLETPDDEDGGYAENLATLRRLAKRKRPPARSLS